MGCTGNACHLRALCCILRENPGDSRTLGELGRAVGAGDRTLSRLFRSDVGPTFPQWRTRLRLHHALIMLAGQRVREFLVEIASR